MVKLVSLSPRPLTSGLEDDPLMPHPGNVARLHEKAWAYAWNKVRLFGAATDEMLPEVERQCIEHIARIADVDADAVAEAVGRDRRMSRADRIGWRPTESN